MTEPLVSVGIPFLVWDDLTDQAVRSVFAQTLSNWELILLLDGDESGLSAVASYARDDSRVVLAANGRRRGLAYSLNRISESARGEYVCRMDADDIMHPDRLAKSLERLVAGGYDVVGTLAYAIDGQSNLLGGYSEGPLPVDGAGFLKSNAFSHPTVMGKTSWFRKNPYDVTISRAEDKELWLRTWEQSNFYKMQERLLFYRIANSIDPGKVSQTYRDNRTVLRMYTTNSMQRLAHISLASARNLIQLTALRAGLGRYVLRRKYSLLTATEARTAQAALVKAVQGHG